MKKTPKRMCVCCRNMFPQKDLIRIVKNSSEEIFVDVVGKSEGRGAYICKNKICFDKAIKQKVFDRIFSIKVNDEIYKKIEREIINE